MNPSNENHEPTTIDDLHDRLVDRGLTEIVGRETVPNLSARILAASVPATSATVGAASRAAQVEPRTRPSRAFWASLVVAAMLLMAASVALTTARFSRHFVARSSTEIRESAIALQNHHTVELAEPDLRGKLMVGTAVNSDAGLAGQTALNEMNTPNSTLPSPYYMTDDVQSFAPSTAPVQNLSSEAAPGTKADRYAEQFQPNENIGLQGLISDAQAAPTLATAPTTLSAIATPQATLHLDQAFLANERDLYHTSDQPADPNSHDDVLRDISAPVTAGTQPVEMLVTPRIIIEEGEEERLSAIGSVTGARPSVIAQSPNRLNFADRGGQDVEVLYSREAKEVALREHPPKVFFEGGMRTELAIGVPLPTPEGTGPGSPGDQYTRIVENPFVKAEGGGAVSTFSIDVDTASYANVRQFLMQMNTLPPPDAVRIEELINYFDYDYAGPADDDMPTPQRGEGMPPEGASDNESAPFAAHVEAAGCPWTPEHRLVRIGIKGREMDRSKRPQSNLVFLVDVSGSMNDPAKLPLVVYGLQQLTRELGENDRVAIVVYASSEGLVLPSTRGDKQDEILAALGRLQAGGSTAGGAGIQLAYQLAEDNFIEGGTNRVILCTDGDFNVGVTSTAELQRMVEQKAKDTKVFLSVLGFGRGNLNDAMMEAISNHGNGNYSYVDNRSEARRVLVKEMTGTLVTIAKDVKIQVEFNPRQVAGYRLLGYENRMLRTEDFNDDKKDAGEIGAGHTVTALYEIVPAGKPVSVGAVDDLKYQQADSPSRLSGEQSDDQSANDAADTTRELLTLKMRYKQPIGDTSRKLEWPVTDDGKSFSAATGDFQFASAVAGFGMLVRNSEHKGNLTYAAALELAQGGIGEDKDGYRAEFVDLVGRAKKLRGE